jgi:ribosomal protein S18 acetylase RimI-like enzyme
MTEPISVRLCTQDDLPALSRREPHANARYAQGHFERQQQGDYLFALAVRGADLLGTSVLDCRGDNLLQPELKSLWVYPEHRRVGAARSLTRYLEEQALDRGFDEIFLRVDPQNAAAIPMYISLDYTPTGDHHLTTYEYVDGLGASHSREQMDAIYRKSLRLLRAQ